MLGMLLATGLAVSHWVVLLPGIVLFGIGAKIRVGSEEKLLRETFGTEFDEYAQRVSAMFLSCSGPAAACRSEFVRFWQNRRPDVGGHQSLLRTISDLGVSKRRCHQ